MTENDADPNAKRMALEAAERAHINQIYPDGASKQQWDALIADYKARQMLWIRDNPGKISTSPFRKLRIAESEYGLQNFAESGYGFRIYGIEVDMYEVSASQINFCFFRIQRTHGKFIPSSLRIQNLPVEDDGQDGERSEEEARWNVQGHEHQQQRPVVHYEGNLHEEDNAEGEPERTASQHPVSCKPQWR
jgi:hypothetical protein